MKHTEIILTGAELASVLNVSDRRVRQLAIEGIVEAGTERGEYMLHPSVSRYVAALESRKDPQVQELNRIKAKMARMDLEKRDGALIALDEALGTVDELCGMFLSALNRLPGMVADRPTLSQREKMAERRRVEDIVDVLKASMADNFEKLEKLGQKPQA